MFCPGSYAHYTGNNGERVVARIIRESPLGDEFRTIAYARPSADRHQVRHVEHDRAPVFALKELECSVQG